MPKERATLAILFADIAQSTKLYERHGDTVTQQMISNCLKSLRAVTAAHNGRVIKTIGDEIMSVFPTAKDAVDAAQKMHSSLEHIPSLEGKDARPPDLYIGVHFGSVIVADEDIFGDAVNVAARMVSLAKQNQIVLTQETVNALPAEYTDCLRCIDKTKVKGKSNEMLIYEILSGRETATVMLRHTALAQRLSGRLELTVAGRTIAMTEGCPVKTLGRLAENDIVVNDYRVSRAHAKIEFRKGRFFLIDQSTNGTYISQSGMPRALLRRDEVLLEGSGVIGLYDDVGENSPDAIHFVVKTVSRGTP